MIGTEPLMRWAHWPGGADPKWIATVIQTETDAPITGSVAGVKQEDVVTKVKNSQTMNTPVTNRHVHKQ